MDAPVSTVNITGLAAGYSHSYGYGNFISNGKNELTGGLGDHGFGTELTISLTRYDFDQLSSAPVCTESTLSFGLNNAPGDCHLQYNEGAFTDMAGVATNVSTPLLTSTFTPDRQRPELVQFREANLSSGVFIVQFSEAIETRTFTPSVLSFHSFYENAPESRLLINASLIQTDDVTLVQLQPTVKDLNKIKYF
jgi:hypothetical protein